MANFDRRTFLKNAAASAALSAPVALSFGPMSMSAARSGFSRFSGKKKRAMDNTGFSRDQLDHMHDVMAAHVKGGGVPGIVTLLSRGGEAHVEAFGTQSLDSKVPMRRDTIFRIASMTKPITAAAAMILIEDGKLQLNEPVDRLLPELANRKVLKRLDGQLDDTVPAKRAITVRDLLTFTMGFGIFMGIPEAYPILKAANDKYIGMGPPNPAWAPVPDEWLRRLGNLPLMHQPGEKWMYNTSADVLGVLVARASAKSFEAFLRERIFEPLDMKDTSFIVPSSKRERFAASYWTNFNTGIFGIYDPSDGGQWNSPPRFQAGGSGLVSTADDYFAFSQMLLNKGKLGNQRILSAASVESMTTDQLTPEQKSGAGLVDGYFDTHGWGFGMSVVTNGVNPAEPAGMYGWDGGLGTSWRADPSANFSGILLTQRAWTSPAPPQVCRDFWAAAYQVLDARAS
jgi:CubicO group peptidase (beta-lactamase class C family)